MKTCKIISTLIVAHALCFVATAQAGVTIFNQNFDGAQRSVQGAQKASRYQLTEQN